MITKISYILGTFVHFQQVVGDQLQHHQQQSFQVHNDFSNTLEEHDDQF